MEKFVSPYVIDRVNHKIIVKKEFRKKADVYGTVEYDTLQAILRDHSGYVVENRTVKSTTKMARKHPKYEQMIAHIVKVEKDKETAANRLGELKHVIASSIDASKTYSEALNWFKKNYDEYFVEKEDSIMNTLDEKIKNLYEEMAMENEEGDGTNG